MSTQAVMKVVGATKDFMVGEQTVSVLKGVTTEVRSGDFFIIFGPSGSGKSTLLHTLLGLESITTGECFFMEHNFAKMSQDETAEVRKHKVGIVYQQPYWIKSLSVLENVAFPLFLLGQLPGVAFDKALEMLKIVGMEGWRGYTPSELSSGQQQRIALARALVNDPLVIIADEPTGNLDTESGRELMQLLAQLNQRDGRTVVMVTHDLEYLMYANRMIRVVDGLIKDEYGEHEIAKLMKQSKGKRGSRQLQSLEMQDNERGTHINLSQGGKT